MAECLFYFVCKQNIKIIILSFVFISLSTFNVNYCKLLPMKVVDEPTNYGLNVAQNNIVNSPPALRARVKPSNFSGPPHLHRLAGRCFSKITNSYKYEFCPFHNVTQHEQTLRWNPFHGILGVWNEWLIQNNTFIAMLMSDGDTCGSQFRSTKIEFACGNETDIDSIAEPTTCNYILRFTTPLVCHTDSMLVYPTMTSNLQDQWDEIEGLLLNGHITTQGYEKRLNILFTSAGIKMAERQQLEELETRTNEKSHIFDSLIDCRQEYEALRKRIQSLETLLSLHGVTYTNDTSLVPRHDDDELYDD